MELSALDKLFLCWRNTKPTLYKWHVLYLLNGQARDKLHACHLIQCQFVLFSACLFFSRVGQVLGQTNLTTWFISLRFTLLELLRTIRVGFLLTHLHLLKDRNQTTKTSTGGVITALREGNGCLNVSRVVLEDSSKVAVAATFLSNCLALAFTQACWVSSNTANVRPGLLNRWQCLLISIRPAYCKLVSTLLCCLFSSRCLGHKFVLLMARAGAFLTHS